MRHQAQALTGFWKKSPPRAEVVFLKKSLPDSFAPGGDGLQLKSQKRKNDEINILLKKQLRRYSEKGTLNQTPIAFPSVIEQHQIVREIESRLSVCDKVEQSISESLEQAKALRQSILKKAFEGKLLSEAEIAQCKQAADYEPASVLLERIKKEKVTGAKKTTVR